MHHLSRIPLLLTIWLSAAYTAVLVTAEDQTPLTFSFGNQLLLLVFVIPTILLFILWEPSYEVINAVIKDFTPTDVGKLAAVVSQQP